VAGADKYKLLYNLVNDNGWERVMVFANRKDEVRRIEERLVRDGINAAQLSGDVPQHKRIKTLEGFREGKIRVLVATDVAGRGIHIDGISHVINFTLPEVRTTTCTASAVPVALAPRVCRSASPVKTTRISCRRSRRCWVARSAAKRADAPAAAVSASVRKLGCGQNWEGLLPIAVGQSTEMLNVPLLSRRLKRSAAA
jgi:reverse gyrase